MYARKTEAERAIETILPDKGTVINSNLTLSKAYKDSGKNSQTQTQGDRNRLHRRGRASQGNVHFGGNSR